MKIILLWTFQGIIPRITCCDIKHCNLFIVCCTSYFLKTYTSYVNFCRNCCSIGLLDIIFKFDRSLISEFGETLVIKSVFINLVHRLMRAICLYLCRIYFSMHIVSLANFVFFFVFIIY